MGFSHGSKGGISRGNFTMVFFTNKNRWCVFFWGYSLISNHDMFIENNVQVAAGWYRGDHIYGWQWCMLGDVGL